MFESIRGILKKFNEKRRAAVSGVEIALMIIGVSIALLIGVNIMPTGLSNWYKATQAGGSLINMSTDFKTMWNLVPIFVALGVIIAVVAIALSKLKDLRD